MTEKVVNAGTSPISTEGRKDTTNKSLTNIEIYNKLQNWTLTEKELQQRKAFDTKKMSEAATKRSSLLLKQGVDKEEAKKRCLVSIARMKESSKKPYILHFTSLRLSRSEL